MTKRGIFVVGEAGKGLLPDSGAPAIAARIGVL
jgi:hypothetical protein